MVIKYHSGTIKATLDSLEKILVDSVEFTLKDDETLCIIGETGSGKTIIACSIMNLLPENVHSDGLVFEFDGKIMTTKEIKKVLGKSMVYIPQSGLECLNPSRTIKKQLFDTLARLKIPYKDRKKKTIEVLQKVGFDNPMEVLDKYPFELSGGMGQRVAIALASCYPAKLVIADEPTNGLDNEAKYEFIQLLSKQFPKTCKLVITHDISVAEYSDSLLVLCKGKTMEQGKSKEILTNPKSTYTKDLLNSLVKNGMKTTPKLRENNSFCPYYSRCKKANPKCQQEIKLKEIDGRKWSCTYD